MFKRLFGQGGGGHGGSGSGPSNAPSSSTHQTINAIQSLSEREEQLEKKKALLEKKINEELEKAKDFSRAKKKSQALMCLKKKKMYEQQLDQIDTLIARVMEQRAMLDTQQTTVQVLSSMQGAAQAQKQTMKDMKIENVDTVIDEIQEVGDQMKQIQDAMQQPIGIFGEMDMDDLDKELEDLEAEELDKQLLEPAPVPAGRLPQAAIAAPAAAASSGADRMPAAPTRPVKAKTKTPEELELEALQAEMAL